MLLTWPDFQQVLGFSISLNIVSTMEFLAALACPYPANFPCCSSTPQISWLYPTCSISLKWLCIYHHWLSHIWKSLPTSCYPIFGLSHVAKRRYHEQDCFAAPWQECSTWLAISSSGEIWHWLLFYCRRNPLLGWWPGWWANWYNLQNVCLWDWWVLVSGISTILLKCIWRSRQVTLSAKTNCIQVLVAYICHLELCIEWASHQILVWGEWRLIYPMATINPQWQRAATIIIQMEGLAERYQDIWSS